ncbi:MAG: hypothetical protein KY475_18830 [Planctomycetes bacterium]|nr:hypothetical protein [Planctomycetota bacterium]
MHLRFAAAVLIAGVFLASASCSQSDPNRKATYPVAGELYVDGKPAENVQVVLHDRAGMDTAQPTFSTTFTGKDGKFSLSTYEAGDGVPAGDYAVTFRWGELNVFSMQYGGPDKLKGKYDDPETTPFQVTVEEGKPTDLGRIELTTE